MPDVVKSNLGPVTAYADAVKHGYTGSREDFGNLLAGAGKNLTDAVTAKDAAQKAATDAASSKQSAADSLHGALTAKSAAEKAVEDASAAKNAAETAKAGAEAAQTAAGEQATAAAASATAAENSNTAAKASADAAAASSKSASDTAGSIKGSLDQIAENKAAVSQLKEATDALKDGKISKFYASSQGNTNLPDSDNGRIVDLKLYGKSEQKQYAGKNLLNSTLGTTTKNGITVTSNSDGSYKIKGTSSSFVYLTLEKSVLLTKNVTYKLCGVPSGLSGNVTIEMDAAPYYGDSGSGVTMTFGVDTQINIRMYVKENTSVDCLLRPMLTTDLTATYDDYEPYVGGIPSPNPEYPQEIKSVVKPVVKVTGKNLVGKLLPGVIAWDSGNYRNTEVGYACTGFIPVKPGEIYTISNGTGGAERWYYSSDKKPVNHMPAGANITVTIPDGIAYMRVSCYVDNKYKFQIEKGSTATAYEPYTEQTATLPYTLNAIPVTSGGNVTIDGQQYIADYVDVEKGKLVRMVDSSKLDTTQSIIGKTDWLLATPTETDLTVDEIATFKALVSHYPVTNVSTTSDQLDGYTVFNYPISLAKGYDYLKTQLGDTRDYIYGIDLMTAEAYVNSEYAAALAEIEV